MLKSKLVRGLVIGAAGLIIPVLAVAKPASSLHRHPVKPLNATSQVKHKTTATVHSGKLNNSAKKLHSQHRTHRSLRTHHVKASSLSSKHAKHSTLNKTHVKHTALSSTRSMAK
jgi:hypothetical protein